jgi:hypothetical protein
MADAARLVNLAPEHPASTPVAFPLDFSAVATACGVLFAIPGSPPGATTTYA